MKKNSEIKWLKEPDSKDYGAAELYLQLLYTPQNARMFKKKLKRVATSRYAAKDILRASSTPIAEIQAFDWTEQHEEINHRTPLSPILIVRQENGGRLVIADGFHRLCAVFATDQEAVVPCKIV